LPTRPECRCVGVHQPVEKGNQQANAEPFKEGGEEREQNREGEASPVLPQIGKE
jgi:hypothetical protein